jgi:hypothetical protein
MFGACNAYSFAVHPQSTNFYRDGRNSTRFDLHMRDGWLDRQQNLSTRMVNNQWNIRDTPDGVPLLWEYSGTDPSPEIYLYATAEGVIRYMWEGESKPDPRRDSFVPMVSVDQAGIPLVDGGTVVRAIFPDMDTINAIYNMALAAGQPDWLPDSIWKHADTMDKLVLWMFQHYTADTISLRVMDSLTATYRRLFKTAQYRQYAIWIMRIASMILYQHRGETCIPLWQDHFTVNVSNGLVTFSA